MAEGNSSNLDNDGISPEQPVSEQPDIPPALIATRNSMWLFKSKFIRSVFVIALGLLVCTAIYSLYIFTRHADPAEIFIFSAAKYSPDKPFTLLVLARDAKTELPLQNQSIDLYMGLSGKEPRKLPAVKTGVDGIALVPVSPCPAGEYQIKAVLRELSAVSNIQVKSVYKSMLTSDKPMYQPGQTIHMRNLALNAIDLHPAPENDVTFKINDPNGNLVFDQTVKSSAYGIASADFQLADQVNTGGYKITVSEGSQQTVKSVDVKNYRLPNYKVSLNTDKKFYAPGDTVTGIVSTEYIWGTPLTNAKITLTASAQITKIESEVIVDPFARFPGGYSGRRGRGGSPPQGGGSQPPQSYTTNKTVEDQQILAEVKGETDSTGRLSFKFQIPSLDRADFDKGAECKIAITALSPAEDKQELNKTLIITAQPLHINDVPEYGQLLAGFPGRIYLFVSDPYGDPVEAELKIGLQTLQTGKNGLALVSVLPTDKEITVTASDRQGHRVEQKICLNYNSDRDAFILKTGKPVINAGEELQLEIVTSNAAGQILIDFVKDDTSLLLLPVPLNNKQAFLKFKIPSEIFGTIQLHAYRILPEGKVIRDLRLLQVTPDNPLTVNASFSKPEYRPGETAEVNFQVKDQTGKPVAAALSIAAVDEMIFALQPENIVSERAYFLLQEELLKPDCQNRAATVLMSDNLPVAGYLLEKKHNVSNLQVQCCPKYAERENPLINQKIEFGNNLFLCFIVLVLILFLSFNIPFLMVCLNGNREHYWLTVEKCYWRSIQRTLGYLQLIFAAATISSLFFIPFVLIDSTTMYASIIKYKINFLLIALLFAGFMFLLAGTFKACNHILRYLNPDEAPDVQKVILLIPWVYVIFIFTFFCFLLSATFFPNTPSLSGLSSLFVILAIFPTCCIGGIRYVICSKEDFDLRHQSRSTLGSGIGKYSGGYYSIWIIASLFYVGPLVITYSLFVLMIIALFMPLTKTIDKLGGDGGGSYYSGSGSPKHEEYFKLEKGGQYFDVNGEQLCKADLPYIRRFFPETLYWQPQLITDEHGRAAILFNVADSITNYRFNISAISLVGQLGAAQQQLKVFQDFFVDFNPPENVTSGDIISIPVILYNYMKEPQQLSVTVQADKAFSIITPITARTMAPQSVTKVSLRVRFEHAGETKILLTAIGKNCKDAIERTVKIAPDGKKETVIVSDVLQKSAQYTILIPKNALPDGRDFFLKIYPTTTTQIADALKGMLQEPYGCFEQTSSITYPNILIFKYLGRSNQLTPENLKKALEYINLGYQRLLTFEVSGGGFSLYGRSPADTRLSAYGLMLFADMETVMPIDRKIIERTAEWLEKQQNPNGSWSCPQTWTRISDLAMTAFITRALSESVHGGDAITKGGQYVIEQSRNCQEPYTLALCANALLKINREQAIAILERLYAMRKENNKQCTWWESSGEGIFYSFNKDLNIETTALSADAMLSIEKYPAAINRTVVWLYRQGLNRNHSGNTIVQVMRTLINYDVNYHKIENNTPLNLSVSLNNVSQSVTINSNNINLLQYLPFKQALHDGENIMIVSGNKNVMMGFQGVATYYLPTQPPTPKIVSVSTLGLSVVYSKNSLQIGDTTTCKVYLENKGRSCVPLGIIVMSVPPGFEIVTAPLEEMVRNAVIDKFAIESNRLILYFREFGLDPLLLSIDLKAVYPVEITAPALTAYPYYEPDNAVFSIPEKLTVIQANTGVE